MTEATPAGRLEERLARLQDLERSRRFHEGRLQLDLTRMEALLAALPPLPPPRIGVHVAGSEGKTSTTELVAAGLSALGLAVGTFTSPHLSNVRERLRIGGAFPPEPLLDRAIDVVEAAAARLALAPTFFEYLTALARVLFAEACVDAVVWEAGLGGRLDATRLMPANLCILTTVSLEHTAVLGPTIAAIAAEKAGVLRPGVPVLLGAGVPGEARGPISAVASALGCELVEQPAQAGDVRLANRDLARRALDLLAAGGLVSPRDALADAAIEAHRVAGRWQQVGRVLFDGAHTVAAAAQLALELMPLAPGAIVFGATYGRDFGAMARGLRHPLPPDGRLLLTRAPGERGVGTDELLAAVGDVRRAMAIEDPSEALATALRLAGPDRIVVVTGSLYLVGRLLSEARA